MLVTQLIICTITIIPQNDEIFIFYIATTTSRLWVAILQKVKLTEDDLLWINHFKANDTIYYLSNQNHIDTVIVKDVQIYNPKNTFIFDTEGQNWLEGDNEFYGFATVELSLIHFTDTFFIRFEIERIAKLGALRSSCNFVNGVG